MILVTGATGHLGNVLVRELISRGEKVRVLILPGESLKPLQGMLIEVIVGDILDREAVSKAMKGISTVFHLAGVIAIRPGMETIMHRVNVEGARNVAEIALESGVDRLIHVSSVHAFRREPHGTVINEETPLALDSPLGSYDRTKAEGTRAVLDIVEKGLNAVIVCPSGIIGSHDYADSEMGKTLLSFIRNKMSILFEGAFDFVDVRDVVKGLILARDKGISGEIYILSGSQITIEKLHQLTVSASGKNRPSLKVPVKLALFAVSIIQRLFHWLKIKSSYTVYSLQTLIDNSLFSSEKAMHNLGYRSRPLAEAVSDFLAWRQLHQKSMKPITRREKIRAQKEETG
jgi:dihydroflavonol-4-reductase